MAGAGPNSLHKVVCLTAAERQGHRVDLFKALAPDVVVAFVPGSLWKLWKKSNGWSENPAEFPGVAMLGASSEWRLCERPTVTQVLRQRHESQWAELNTGYLRAPCDWDAL